MAIGTPALLTSGTNGASGQTVLTSASIDPTADREYWLAFRSSFGNTGAPVVAGAGLSWSRYAEIEFTAPGDNWLQVYRGTGTPSEGTVTITRAGADTFNDSIWHIIEIPDASVVEVAGQDTNSGGLNTVLTITLAGVTPGNGLVTFFALESSGFTCVEKGGWTELEERILSPGGQLATHYQLSDDSESEATYNNSNTQYLAGICIEFGEPGAGGSPLLLLHNDGDLNGGLQ